MRAQSHGQLGGFVLAAILACTGCGSTKYLTLTVQNPSDIDCSVTAIETGPQSVATVSSIMLGTVAAGEQLEVTVSSRVGETLHVMLTASSGRRVCEYSRTLLESDDDEVRASISAPSVRIPETWRLSLDNVYNAAPVPKDFVIIVDSRHMHEHGLGLCHRFWGEEPLALNDTPKPVHLGPKEFLSDTLFVDLIGKGALLWEGPGTIDQIVTVGLYEPFLVPNKQKNHGFGEGIGSIQLKFRPDGSYYFETPGSSIEMRDAFGDKTPYDAHAKRVLMGFKPTPESDPLVLYLLLTRVVNTMDQNDRLRESASPH